MKKHVRIAIILILAGLILCGASYGLSAAGIGNSGPHTYEKRSFATAAEITDFFVQDFNTELVLFTSTDEQFHVSYYENDQEVYDLNFDEASGSLRMEKNASKKWFDWLFTFKVERHPVTVEIPAGMLPSIEARTSNAPIDIKNLDVQNLVLASSNGAISTTGLRVSERLEATTTNAPITLKDVRAQGRLSATSSNGLISMRDVRAAHINAQTTNSSIRVENAASEESVTLNTLNGEIVLDAVAFETALHAATANSPIRGTVLGNQLDYAITSGTTNGSNNLPSQTGSGSKSLDIHTSNGNIEVTFLN